MMINPPIDELVEKVDSRYQLVTVVAKRAREIISNDTHFTDKPLATAIEELYDNKIKITDGEDE